MIVVAMVLRKFLIHAIVAVVFLLVNSAVLLFSFDSAARTAMIEEPPLIPQFTPYHNGVQTMRVGLFRYRGLLLFTSLGLCLLVLVRPKGRERP